MRTRVRYTLEDPAIFKKQLLQWSASNMHVAWLDSNNHSNKYSSFDAVLAVGAESSLVSDTVNAFEKLQEYQERTSDWIFGYLSYDLKNDIEDLESEGVDGLQLPDLQFFQPAKILRIEQNTAEFLYLLKYEQEIPDDFHQIISLQSDVDENSANDVQISFRLDREEYIRKVDDLLNHIQRGDIYEANFCQEIFAEKAFIDPITTYNRLNSISKPPFAAYFRAGDTHILSASPERFLKKQTNTVISQPIKGTAKRNEDPILDKTMKDALSTDLKERAENIMIVDLVRNDLSKYARKGSVRVSELCKVYSYEQLHQMISTVAAELQEGIHPVDVIKSAFPMGSMTGAPKVSAMQLIEKFETSRRGIYSGALGYFDPQGDFDFSVVIRSIIYNSGKKYLSFPVGSAITSRAKAEFEYDECMAKARAMYEVLTQPNPLTAI